MMKFVEKVGNIKVYTEQNAKNDITVSFFNGSDMVMQEVYFADDTLEAIANLFSKMDIYTEEGIAILCPPSALEKVSENTYKFNDPEQPEKPDWFCRIDNSRYFKHICKSEDEFVRDKNGMRIIDR